MSNSAETDPIKFCVVCREPIKAGAHKCTKCSSFQDFRRYADLSAPVLSLIVALVSVAAFALPRLQEALKPKGTEITLAFQGGRPPSFLLLASNEGSKPGSLVGASLRMHSKTDGRDGLAAMTFNASPQSPTGTSIFVPDGKSTLFEASLVKGGSTVFWGDDWTHYECKISYRYIDFKNQSHTKVTPLDCLYVGMYMMSGTSVSITK